MVASKKLLPKGGSIPEYVEELLHLLSTIMVKGQLFHDIIETYGWPNINELLTLFKEGSTYDNALQMGYSFDIIGLEERWRTYICSD